MANEAEKILEGVQARPASDDNSYQNPRYLDHEDSDGVPRSVSFFFRTAIFFNFVCYIADRRYKGADLAGKLTRFEKEHPRFYKVSICADWIIRAVCVLIVLALAIGAGWKVIFG